MTRPAKSTPIIKAGLKSVRKSRSRSSALVGGTPGAPSGPLPGAQPGAQPGAPLGAPFGAPFGAISGTPPGAATGATSSPSNLHLPIGPRLKAVLQVAYRARRPFLLEGTTGIGKSEVVLQVARELGIDIVILDLSLLEPPDLVGLPVIREGRTTYASPNILPTGGAGILMLEELNRAERYIQQPALQLLTARRLHEYTLPDGWSTCAAINPEEGDYQVTPLDPALRSRFLNLFVQPERSAWLRWAQQHHVHPTVLDVARTHSGIFDDVPPRTWAYVADLLDTLTANERRDDTLLRDLFGGYLPQAWVEVLLDQLASWGPELGIDPYRLLRAYHRDVELGQIVIGFKQNGHTDHLDQLVTRLGTMLGGPELGALIGRGEFALQAFERLLVDLPGDGREHLQEIFGQNPLACVLLEVQPPDILRAYQGSEVAQTVARWVKKPTLRHRALSLVTATCNYLGKLRGEPRLLELRRSTDARIGLGILLDQLGADAAAPLWRTLRELSLDPVPPGSGGRRR